MRNSRHHSIRAVLVSMVMAFGGLILAGQQGAGAGRYTAAQAAAGRTVYQAQCASCHLPDLKGQGDAAPLAGSEFMDAWGRRSTRELASFMQLTMPPARPGGLSQDDYVNIIAFVLQANGAAAGTQTFTAATEVAINSVATGQVRQAPRRNRQDGQGNPHKARAPRRLPRRGGRGRGAAPPPVGDHCRRRGEKLRARYRRDAAYARAPGDWLMIRRDYQRRITVR